MPSATSSRKFHTTRLTAALPGAGASGRSSPPPRPGTRSPTAEARPGSSARGFPALATGRLVVSGHLSLQFTQLRGHLLVGKRHLAQPHESPNDVDARLDRPAALEHVAAVLVPCSVKTPGGFRRPRMERMRDSTRSDDTTLFRVLTGRSSAPLFFAEAGKQSVAPVAPRRGLPQKVHKEKMGHPQRSAKSAEIPALSSGGAGQAGRRLCTSGYVAVSLPCPTSGFRGCCFPRPLPPPRPAPCPATSPHGPDAPRSRRTRQPGPAGPD